MQIIANNKAALQLEMVQATFRWLRKSNARNLTDYAPQINDRKFILALCANSTAKWVGHPAIESKSMISISLIDAASLSLLDPNSVPSCAHDA